MIEQHGCPEASHQDCPDLNKYAGRHVWPCPYYAHASCRATAACNQSCPGFSKLACSTCGHVYMSRVPPVAQQYLLRAELNAS